MCIHVCVCMVCVGVKLLFCIHYMCALVYVHVLVQIMCVHVVPCVIQCVYVRACMHVCMCASF